MTDSLNDPPPDPPLTPAQRSRFVQRAALAHASLLATSLTRYAEQEGLSWEALAQSLHCTSEQLNAVAMCRPPRPESFAADVSAIAEGYVEPERLLPLLRHLQVLDIFRAAQETTQAADNSEQHIALLAAQDREPSPESQNTPSDPDSPSS